VKNDSVDGFGPSSVGIGGRTRVVVAATRRSRQERERGLRIDPRDTMTITPRRTPPSPFRPTPRCHPHSVKNRHPRSLSSLTVAKAVVPTVHAGPDAASAAQHSDGVTPNRRPAAGIAVARSAGGAGVKELSREAGQRS